MGQIQLRRAAATLVAVFLAAGLLGSDAGAARGAGTLPPPGASPEAVATAFSRALDARDWTTACALMLPVTRSYTVETGSAPVGFRPAGQRAKSCAQSLLWRTRGHLLGEARLSSSRLLSTSPVELEGARASVSTEVALTFACPRGSRDISCPRRVQHFRRPDRFYLMPDASGEWRIARTGNAIEWLWLNGPYSYGENLLPPVGPTALAAPATALAPPSFPCEGPQIARFADDKGDVWRGDEYRGVSTVPWFDIASITILRTGSAGACLLLRTVAPVRPDATFSIHWYTYRYSKRGRGSEHFLSDGRGGELEVTIDGDGAGQAVIDSFGGRLQAEQERHTARFGFLDGQTLAVGLDRTSLFDLGKRYAIDATLTADASSKEPLIAAPEISSYDQTPFNECLLYPSGRTVQMFPCGAPAG